MARKESAAPHLGWSDIIGIVLIASALLLALSLAPRWLTRASD